MSSGRERVLKRLTINVLGLLAIVAAIVSCSPSASIALSLSPASATVVPGGSVDIVVNLVRNGGAAGDVSLSAAATSGLSFSFSPSVLAAGVTSSTLTVTATASADLGPRQVQLSASGAGLSASTELAVDVELMTVTGTVNGFLGQPLEGATLYIEGHTPATSAADGSFEIAGVTLPYDLTVAFGTVAANTYIGLTTAHPIVSSYAAQLVPAGLPRATVTGNLTGTVSPVPVEHRLLICPEGIGKVVYAVQSCAYVSAGFSSYTLDLNWFEGSEASVRLRAYLYTLDSGEVTGIAASAVTTLDVTDGGAHVQDIELVSGSPQLADLQVSMTAPVGYSGGVQVVTSLANGRSHLAEYSSINSSPTAAVAPLFSGASYTVLVTANGPSSTSGAWRVGLKSGDSVTIDLPAGPALVTPVNGATGVNLNTNFTATNPVGGSLHFVLSPQDPSKTLFIISTVDTSVKLPDLSAIGLGLEPAMDYSYQMLATPDTESANAMVEGGGYMGSYLDVVRAALGGPAPTRDGAIHIISGWAFTTQ